ncbi:MAG TPA: RNA 2',3'-cyclic phosphodiesterase [Thermodesulfobacteriota bacterium]|nr:RNA 2',3'-cyclic phosphodiesterase [Thermodesulfobacteriota bacterium]
MRVFIAALIPQEIKYEIKKYVDEIKPYWEGVKWENQEKLHVTLKFLGEIEESKVEEVGTALRVLIGNYSPFEMEISSFGGFPNLRNPRVLFIALSENKELSRLYNEIEEGLERVGFSAETRPFVPHITVGRIKSRARIKGTLPFPKPHSFLISEVAVMRSVLGPEGSKYSTISLFRLDKKM